MSSTSSHKRKTAHLVLLLCVVYFISYFSRKSFSAIKLGFPDGFLTDSDMGAIGSALFFAYGAGQIVSGFLGDRIDPRKLIFCGLGLTTLCNALFPYITSVPALIVLWALNGFAQALFWPPITKLLATYMRGTDYVRATSRIVIAANISSVLVYVVAALVIRYLTWNWMFAIVVAVCLAAGVYMLIGFRALPAPPDDVLPSPDAAPVAEAVKRTRKSVGLWTLLISSGLLFCFGSTATMGFVRDGAEEWLPTYFSDVFRLPGDISTLTGMLMPVFAVVCIRLSVLLLERVFHNDERLEAIVLLLVCGASFGALALFIDVSPYLSLPLCAVCIGCVHATNTCITCYLPVRFVKTGRVSTVSGLVNAFVYLGSTAATALIPRLLSLSSWRIVMLCWAGVAVLGSVLCMIFTTVFRKSKTESA